MINNWYEYPECKPESSRSGSKIFYHAILKSEYHKGYAYKCWYSDGYWLCDTFQTVVSIHRFKPCQRNAKHEIAL